MAKGIKRSIQWLFRRTVRRTGPCIVAILAAMISGLDAAFWLVFVTRMPMYCVVPMLLVRRRAS